MKHKHLYPNHEQPDTRIDADIRAFVERLWQKEACMADPILFATKAIEQYLRPRLKDKL
jgi:hypothetical protein